MAGSSLLVRFMAAYDYFVPRKVCVELLTVYCKRMKTVVANEIVIANEIASLPTKK